MESAIWFFILAFLGIILFAYNLRKQRSSKVLRIYFFVSGLAFVFEFFVLIVWKAYFYYPDVLGIEWFDAILGANISQALVVPIIITAVLTFQLKRIWYLISAFLLMGIESFFLYLGIYEQFWWKTIYTGFFIVVAFFITEWWVKYENPQNKRTQFLNGYGMTATVTNTIAFYSVALFKTHLYTVNVFKDPARDHAFGNGLFLFVFSFLITYVILFRFKLSTLLLFLVLTVIIDTILINFDILQVAPYWGVPQLSVVMFLCILLLRWISQKIIRANHPE